MYIHKVLHYFLLSQVIEQQQKSRSGGSGSGSVGASPFRSNSLQPKASSPVTPTPNEVDERKKSCPGPNSGQVGHTQPTIPEYESLAATEMAAAIAKHDRENARAVSPRPTRAAEDNDHKHELRKVKKMLSKRMASDTDLWLSLRDHQQRYSRMATVVAASNASSSSSATNVAPVPATAPAPTTTGSPFFKPVSTYSASIGGSKGLFGGRHYFLFLSSLTRKFAKEVQS